MKLWYVIQWGNLKDGGNGPDTQCIVRAPDLKSAIEKGELHFTQMYSVLYRDGKADTIRLMGDDGREDGAVKMVIQPWFAHAYNLGLYESWYRDYDTGEWLDHKTMYGEK